MRYKRFQNSHWYVYKTLSGGIGETKRGERKRGKEKGEKRRERVPTQCGQTLVVRRKSDGDGTYWTYIHIAIHSDFSRRRQ